MTTTPAANPSTAMSTAQIPAQPAPFTPSFTRDMLVVHKAFRREFRLLPQLVRATPIADLARAKVIAEHLDLIVEFLHHHHGGEDRLLWPRLLQRVGEESAPIVLLMEAHHEAVSAQLDEVERLRTPYAATASETQRIELAEACERLNVLLFEHLSAEEQRLLPLAELHMSREEWEKLGEEGMGSLPKRKLPLAFGMMQYEGDPETLAEMTAGAPLPVRVIVPPLARRAFRKHALRVHGTETP